MICDANNDLCRLIWHDGVDVGVLGALPSLLIALSPGSLLSSRKKPHPCQSVVHINESILMSSLKILEG